MRTHSLGILVATLAASLAACSTSDTQSDDAGGAVAERLSEVSAVSSIDEIAGELERAGLGCEEVVKDSPGRGTCATSVGTVGLHWFDSHLGRDDWIATVGEVYQLGCTSPAVRSQMTMRYLDGENWIIHPDGPEGEDVAKAIAKDLGRSTSSFCPQDEE